MKKFTATLILTILFLPLYPQSNKLTGSWQGSLSVSGTELRLVFHITKNAEGTLEGTMDSPDQGAYGIALGDISEEEDSVIIHIPAVFGSYEGKFTSPETIEGTWNQGAASLPLNISYTEHTDVLLRPQEPQPPFPYKVREVEIFNSEENITLTGTLTLPKGKGPFPGVILVSGSGPQDRNEEIFGHKPFLVLADYLTRNEVAVLRYDDRGTGKSGGSFASATTENFATDARAALLYLESYPEINTGLTGIIGHSEGGLIAPMVASEVDEVDFIVMLAGPGLKGAEILILQTQLIAKAKGASDKEISNSVEFNKKAYAIVISEPDPQKAGKQLEKLVDEYLSGVKDDEKNDPQNNRSAILQGLVQLNGPWFRYFLSFDPATVLTKVTCPLLALNGENDLQVPPKQNLDAIEKALQEGGNSRYVIKEMKGLNHLFQHSETGSPSEYAKIEETFSEEALELITIWINGLK